MIESKPPAHIDDPIAPIETTGAGIEAAVLSASSADGADPADAGAAAQAEEAAAADRPKIGSGRDAERPKPISRGEATADKP